nr:MAG TPA: hypothetical protein [Caudoviricetes sp.]
MVLSIVGVGFIKILPHCCIVRRWTYLTKEASA